MRSLGSNNLRWVIIILATFWAGFLLKTKTLLLLNWSIIWSGTWQYPQTGEWLKFIKVVKMFYCSNLIKRSHWNRLFFSIWIFFHKRVQITNCTTEEWRAYFFHSPVPLPTNSQTLRRLTEDYYRGLTSAHSWRPDPNRKQLFSRCKSLNTKLSARL